MGFAFGFIVAVIIFCVIIPSSISVQTTVVISEMKETQVVLTEKSSQGEATYVFTINPQYRKMVQVGGTATIVRKAGDRIELRIGQQNILAEPQSSDSA